MAKTLHFHQHWGLYFPGEVATFDDATADALTTAGIANETSAGSALGAQDAVQDMTEVEALVEIVDESAPAPDGDPVEHYLAELAAIEEAQREQAEEGQETGRQAASAGRGARKAASKEG